MVKCVCASCRVRNQNSHHRKSAFHTQPCVFCSLVLNAARPHTGRVLGSLCSEWSTKMRALVQRRGNILRLTHTQHMVRTCVCVCVCVGFHLLDPSVCVMSMWSLCVVKMWRMAVPAVVGWVNRRR